MNVVSVHLRNFRNHENTVVEFGQGINVIFGRNGQGKTNVLEAISFLSLTKSFYASNDVTALQIGKEVFEIEGILRNGNEICHAVRVAYSKSLVEKQFTINQSRPETLSAVIGRFPLVVLSPENSAITFGGPAERRKFVDILLSQISKTYLDDLQEYRRTLRQRNRILLDARLTGGYNPEMLDPWNANLVRYGSCIVARRLALMREFDDYVKRAYQSIAPDDGLPSIDYETFSRLDPGMTVEQIEEAFRAVLAEKLAEEYKRGTSLVGPHRDEIHWTLNGIGVKQYASQGQHKTFLIALKIAEFFYISDRRGERPILLLDDVFSELDRQRARSLLAHVAGLGQSIITTTDETPFGEAIRWNEPNRKFYVENGTCRAA